MENEPATKEDVRAIVREAIEEFAAIVKLGFDAVDERFDGVAKQFDQVDQRFEQHTKELHEYIDKKTQETLDHFDAVAENIQKDVAGANRSEIDLIQHRQENHEERIERLEEKTGAR